MSCWNHSYHEQKLFFQITKNSLHLKHFKLVLWQYFFLKTIQWIRAYQLFYCFFLNPTYYYVFLAIIIDFLLLFCYHQGQSIRFPISLINFVFHVYLYYQLYPGFYLISPNDVTKGFYSKLDICPTRNIYCWSLLKNINIVIGQSDCILRMKNYMLLYCKSLDLLISKVKAWLIYVYFLSLFKHSVIIDIPKYLVWISSSRIISQTKIGNRNWVER